MDYEIPKGTKRANQTRFDTSLKSSVSYYSDTSGNCENLRLICVRSLVSQYGRCKMNMYRDSGRINSTCLTVFVERGGRSGLGTLNSGVQYPFIENNS